MKPVSTNYEELERFPRTLFIRVTLDEPEGTQEFTKYVAGAYSDHTKRKDIAVGNITGRYRHTTGPTSFGHMDEEDFGIFSNQEANPLFVISGGTMLEKRESYLIQQYRATREEVESLFDALNKVSQQMISQ